MIYMYHSSPFSFLSFPPNVVSFICFLLSFLPNLTFFYTPSSMSFPFKMLCCSGVLIFFFLFSFLFSFFSFFFIEAGFATMTAADLKKQDLLSQNKHSSRRLNFIFPKRLFSYHKYRISHGRPTKKVRVFTLIQVARRCSRV